MRVLHFALSFSPLPETFVYDLVTELEDQGVDNHVATFDRVNEEDRPFSKVHDVDRPNRWSPRRLFYRALVPFGVGEARTSDWPQTRERLASVVKKVQPDVIHAQFGPAGVLMGPVAESAGIPLVVSFHGYDVSILAQEEFWVRQYSDLFGHISVAHTVSSHISERVERLGGDPDRIRVVHNGIKVREFQDGADTVQTASDTGSVIRCLHVGRLVEKKAPLHLIQAFTEARERLGDTYELRLTIAGDGPLRSDAEREATRLDVEDSVHFVGEIPHSRVPKLMAQSTIYTMHCMTASDGDQEGMGVTFAEASAVGLPIVTTRHNGIPDVVLDGETGFLVPEGDTKAMSKKICALAKNEGMRREMGSEGRKHIEENFNLSDQVAKMRTLYKEIAQNESTT
jgi:glycosyltransferase involved in cell wall biosynthesis